MALFLLFTLHHTHVLEERCGHWHKLPFIGDRQMQEGLWKRCSLSEHFRKPFTLTIQIGNRRVAAAAEEVIRFQDTERRGLFFMSPGEASALFDVGRYLEEGEGKK